MSGEPATMIEGLVVHVVADALGVQPQEIVTAPTLFDVPGFDSLTVLTILSRLEAELGAEIPPDAIVPEAFESLPALIALFQGAASWPGGQA